MVWHSILTGESSINLATNLRQPSKALLQCYLIFRLVSSTLAPPLLLLLWVPMLVPAWYSVTLGDDFLRVCRLAVARTIPRGDVTFIGLGNREDFPLSKPETMVSSSDLYRPDGRPLPVMRLLIVCRNRRRYWPGRLRRLVLHPSFTRQEMDAMQSWATAEQVGA